MVANYQNDCEIYKEFIFVCSGIDRKSILTFVKGGSRSSSPSY